MIQKIKISSLVLMMVFSFSSSILALNSNQPKDQDSGSLFFLNNNLINQIRQVNGNDVIYKGGFEPVPILILSANPTNINSGGLSIITWNLEENASNCVKSGAWTGSLSGSDVGNGTHNEVIDNIITSSTFKLQCSNTFGDSPIRSIDVFVDVKAAPLVTISSVANGINSAILNWTLENDAVFCQKSGAWSGLIQGNPTLANSSFNLEVFTNGIYTLECSNSFGTNSDSVTVSNIMSVGPPVLSFSANPTHINSGESSMLTWIIGNSPTACTKSGDWSGNMSATEITKGVHSLPISNITSSRVYSLVCVNSSGTSGVRTVTVTVNQGNSNCESQPPILNGNEDFSIIPDPTPLGNNQGIYDGLYDSIAPGGGWPGILGASSFFSLTKNQYMAMQFNTDNTNSNAKLVFTVPGNGQGPPSIATTVSISQCPGDFTTHLNQDRCLVVGGAVPSLRWSQNPSSNPLIFCVLDKNTTYFLNIVHSNSIANGYVTTSCTGANYCGGIFSQANN